MDNKLAMSQDCLWQTKHVLATEKTSSTLGIISRLSEEIPALYSALLRLCLKYCVQFWALQCREDKDLLK